MAVPRDAGMWLVWSIHRFAGTDGRGSVPRVMEALAFALAAGIPAVATLLLPVTQAGVAAALWLFAVLPVCLIAYRRGIWGLAVATGLGLLLIGATHGIAMLLGRPHGTVTTVLLGFGAASLLAGGLAVVAGRNRRAREMIHALIDPLTGLPNRMHAELFLEREFAVAELGRPFAVVLFDVDRFADFNHTNGESAANGVLRTIATILRQNTRRMNISARYGADEFICLLSGATDEGAFIFAQRIQERLHAAGGVATLPTVSIGIGCYTADMAGPRELLRASSDALVQAKQDGGDRIRVAGWSLEHLERSAANLAAAAAAAPAPGPPVGPPVDDSRTAPAATSRTAFVFTSDGVLRRRIATTLGEASVRVVEGTTAADGIRPLNSDFDLVVLDLSAAHGVQDMIREIRLRFPATRIVGITRLQGESIAASVLTARVDGHYLERSDDWVFEPPVEDLLGDRDRIHADSVRARQLSDEVRAKAREAKRFVEEVEAKLRSVEQAIQEVVFRTDAAGRWHSLSPAWTAITHHRVDDSVGADFLEFFHADDRAALGVDFDALVGMERPYLHREARVLVRTGGQRWVEVRAQVELDRTGQPLGTSGTLSDVTDRKTAEEALRRSEEYYRSLIDNAADLVAVFDDAGCLLHVSPAVERLLGYDTEERVGTTLFDLVHREDVRALHQQLEHVTATPGAAASFEVRLRHSNGSWRSLAVSVRNLCHLPAVGGYVVNAHDVTAHREAERALRERDEELFRARKMDAIGILAGGVAHDFNNLLTSIQGHAELIIGQLPDDRPIRRDLVQIQEAASRAASLTRQLLAFSRRQVLQPKVIDLNVFVSDMQKMLVRLAGDSVALRTELSASPARVKADPAQIEQVILNLAVNARDAMPEGGVLTMRTDNVVVSPADARRDDMAPGRYVRLTVSDTGHGIPDELLSQIFDPFFTTKGQARSTGLGLSTVYGIAKQSGGHVSAHRRGENGAEEGTRFTVLLPEAAENAEPAAQTARTPATTQGSETIALVEDEKTVLDLATRILRSKGYHVIPAENGRAAIDEIGRYPHRIDMLVTDVVMPGMNGRDLADRINVMRPGVKILFMSGYSAEAVAQHGVLARGAAFIEKPFSPETLLRKVRDMLDAAGEPTEN